MNPLASKTLPSREISYNYCVAMFTAQQFEDDLRYILDSAQYYGLVDAVELTKRDREKYRDSVELLDKATCGRLLVALKNRIKLSKDCWDILQAALDDRNFLAHKFLVQFDYEDLTARKESEIIRVIYEIYLRLWKAVQIIRALKRSLDERTDHIDVSIDELFKDCGMAAQQPRKKPQR